MNKLRRIVNCASDTIQYIRLYGWQVGVSKDRVGDRDKWHFSAILFPHGRGSTTEDWDRLGKMVAVVQTEAGLTGEPVTNAETAAPDAVQHFIWLEPDSRNAEGT